MEQIAGTVRQSAEVATQADALAGSARTVAERGGALMQEVEPLVSAQEAKIASALTAHERQTLMRLLCKVYAAD